MSDSNRHDRYSSIVAIAAIVAVVLISWFNQPTDSQVREPSPAEIEKPPNDDVSEVAPATRAFDPWSDTYAQWLMALFSIAATGASIWAVYLLSRTLNATADAVDAANRTNDLMMLERRPWVTLRRNAPAKLNVIEYPPESPKGQRWKYGTRLLWRYDLENVGRSPAFGIKVKQKIVCVDNFFDGRKCLREFVDSIDTKWETQAQDTIFPGEKLDMRESEMASAVAYQGEGDPVFLLLFAVTYRSQESDIVGLEARCISIDFDARTRGPWAPLLLEFSEARITR